MIAPLLCTPAEACWIEGLGFRAVIDTGTACAIDDTPFNSKYDPPLDIYAGTYGLGSSLVTAAALDPIYSTSIAAPIYGDSSHLPMQAVPLPASSGLLLAALVIAAAPKLWRAVGRFADWFEAERGTGPGQNGWVG